MSLQSRNVVGSRSLTEFNVGQGKEYEYFQFANLASSASMDIIFQPTVGSIMRFKDEVVSFNDEFCDFQIFENPTFTGGSAGNIFNLNNKIQLPSGVTVLEGSTVTDPGTAVSVPFRYIGSTGQGQQASAAQGIGGLDRVMSDTDEYLLRVTNPNSQTMDVSIFVTWFRVTTP